MNSLGDQMAETACHTSGRLLADGTVRNIDSL